MSICSGQSERKFVCMPMGGKSEMRVKGMTYEGSGTAPYPCTIL